MLLWLYALADAASPLEDVTGVSGEPPLVISTASCAIVAGWIEQRPPIDRESLTRQDAVVRHVHARTHAVLPVRFGTHYADIDAARRSVGALDAAILARLDLVRDREQMTIRTGPPSRPEADDSGASGASSASGASGASGAASLGEGTRYLERLAAARVPAGIRPLVDALKPLVHATRVESGTRAGIATVYHLVDRGRGAEYIDAAHRAARVLPELTVRISGPSPAYAFAELT